MLRADLPFRRVAVVLSGGGALGAYEVGVLRLLELMRLKPKILAGTSSGAINAVIWLANDFRSDSLRDTWRRMTSEGVGMRWTTLGLRVGGMALAAYALIQAAFTLLGWPEVVITGRLWRSEGAAWISILLDVLAWIGVAVAGALTVRVSRPAERWLAALYRPDDPGRERRLLLWILVILAVLHAWTWALGVPWPHRFSASLIGAGLVVWLVRSLGKPHAAARQLLARLLPETRGRGLWGDAARRKLVTDLVARGDRKLLTEGDTFLIISALALDNGRITHFVSGPSPGPAFESRFGALDEVVRLNDPAQVIDAAVASSAIPLAFEPVRTQGREFVDAGQFSNQPLDAAIAARADALLVVLAAPGIGPLPPRRSANLIELGARLLEVATWRHLRIQLEGLPASWHDPNREGPAPLVVVEPEGTLPGGLLAFDAAVADELVRRGQQDAARALNRAGWLEAPASA